MVLSFTRGTIPEANREDRPNRTDRMLLACAELSMRRSLWVGIVTAAVIAASVFFGTRVIVDNTLTGLLEPGHPTSTANTLADNELGGILGLEVDLQGSVDSLKNPDVLRALAELDEWALAQPSYRSATGPASLLLTFNQVIGGRREIPDSAREIAQLYAFGEGAGLDRFITLSDYATGRALLRTRDEGGLRTEELSSALQAELDRRFADLPMEATLTGTPFVAYRGINRVTGDLRDSLALAFVIITVMILLLFRSPRIALLCLIPNALPLIIGYGTLGLMGWLLDPTPAVVFTVALGIAVDDTIHLVARWREEIAAGRTNEEAIRSSVLHTGRAVTITSIVLAAGFAVNSFSSFPTMTIMGLLGATVIIVALLSDLFVLPALLYRFGQPARSEA